MNKYYTYCMRKGTELKKTPPAFTCAMRETATSTVDFVPDVCGMSRRAKAPWMRFHVCCMQKVIKLPKADDFCSRRVRNVAERERQRASKPVKCKTYENPPKGGVILRPTYAERRRAQKPPPLGMSPCSSYVEHHGA